MTWMDTKSSATKANFTIHSPITMGPYPHSLEEQELVRVLEQELAQEVEVAESCQVEVIPVLVE